jgi:hypothetical protein
MRCPPGLVFDDSYQRCEWPGAGVQSPSHRLSSLRDKKLNKDKIKSKNLELMTTKKQQNSTVSPSNKRNKIVEP